ncbi:Hypothetical predicted protein [Marmota monax]|uniref:Uncharacterized protein n=1 Tax=Marmota monax TaxID=9995 RepID=A0A5E4CG94_MARMO|nr:hypothetical protein GHT09_005006 [Marmota monax]VTJ80917.1 Hypothetical predicted protein [Marmota monax]
MPSHILSQLSVSSFLSAIQFNGHRSLRNSSGGFQRKDGNGTLWLMPLNLILSSHRTLKDISKVLSDDRQKNSKSNARLETGSWINHPRQGQQATAEIREHFVQISLYK